MPIKATNVLSSVSPSGKWIHTLELELPRIILAEFNTHRMFSRNAQSTRAVPLKRQIAHMKEDMFVPKYFYANQGGMVGAEVLTGWRNWLARKTWIMSGRMMGFFAGIMDKLNVHKQHAGRMLEPWTYTKAIVTSTEWENFFNLRCAPDAQPEFAELADQILYQIAQCKLFTSSSGKTQRLEVGQWHMPYVDITELTTSRLRRSVANCAAVSYRPSTEMTASKAESIVKKLAGKGGSIHSSPFEHQAKCMDSPYFVSANFRGWYQLRHHEEAMKHVLNI